MKTAYKWHQPTWLETITIKLAMKAAYYTENYCLTIHSCKETEEHHMLVNYEYVNPFSGVVKLGRVDLL